ncbi:hypothetical protein GCK32_004024 [Trichostrongylus colubriformis]|uniref:Uncharacterized protein n=1 Tax=Trichostrongylus colubriformis TaxID=6319 RepID=A0AAN8FJH7_TRICO
MWSPWSFCSNDVMVRVRACSTVRGYKCVGHNKEFQSCDSSKTNFTPSPTGIPVKATGEPAQALPDLDFLDPYSEDRRLAMKQLYQDYEVSVPEEEKVSLKPRYRPASPVPLREPVIIAQYAQRFPQPPPEIEEVELPSTTEIPPIKDNRHVIRTRPPVPWKTSTYAMPTSTASSQPLTTTTTTAAPTTMIEDSIESLSSTTEKRESEKVTSSTQKMSTASNYLEESDNTQWEADESTAGPRDYEGIGDEEEQDEILEYGEKQVSPEISTMPTTTSTTSTTTSPSATTTRKLVGPNTSTTQAAVNLLPTSIFLGSPGVSEGIPSASITHLDSPSSKRKGSSTTGEWENMRGKQSRLRRIQLLNRRARVKSLSLIPKKTTTKNITIEVGTCFL